MKKRFINFFCLVLGLVVFSGVCVLAKDSRDDASKCCYSGYYELDCDKENIISFKNPEKLSNFMLNIDDSGKYNFVFFKDDDGEIVDLIISNYYGTLEDTNKLICRDVIGVGVQNRGCAIAVSSHFEANFNWDINYKTIDNSTYILFCGTNTKLYFKKIDDFKDIDEKCNNIIKEKFNVQNVFEVRGRG